MILITGGAWQGKYTYAVRLEKSMRDDENKHASGRTEPPRTSEPPRTADGLTDPYEAAYRSVIIRGFHNYVRRLLHDGKGVEPFIEAVIRHNPHVIITSDEIGCGIVPVSAEERAWREAAGRAQARLAAESSRVYRLVCGVPQQLK